MTHKKRNASQNIKISGFCKKLPHQDCRSGRSLPLSLIVIALTSLFLLPVFLLPEKGWAQIGSTVVVDLAVTDMGVDAPVSGRQTFPSTSTAETSKQAFLNAVKRVITQNPDKADNIVGWSKQFYPEIGPEIFELAQNVIEDLTPIVATETTNVSPLGWAAVGAGVVGAVGVAAVAIMSDSNDSFHNSDNSRRPIKRPSDAALQAMRTPEFIKTEYLQALGADYALARGGTGAGITIAVVDTGINPTDPEFAGRINPNWCDATISGLPPTCQGPGADIRDLNSNVPRARAGDLGHGHPVAQILAGARNGVGTHGVAPEATLLPLKYIDRRTGHRTRTASDDGRALLYNQALANKARIINSFSTQRGSRSQYYLTKNSNSLFDLGVLADMGAVIVFASGDNHNIRGRASPNPTLPGMLPFVKPSNHSAGIYRISKGIPPKHMLRTTDFSVYADRWLTVGAVDKTNTMIAHANRCGVAMNFCIVAYGGDIPVQSAHGTFEKVTATGRLIPHRMTGTAFAAPQVSGAAAVLMQLFPAMTNRDVVAVLKASATDLGAPGVDPIYGHGLLNLNAATRPFWPLIIATKLDINKPGFSLANSLILLGIPFGDALALSFKERKIALLDSFNRSFLFSMNNMARNITPALDVTDALYRFSDTVKPHIVQIGTSLSLSMRHVPKANDEGYHISEFGLSLNATDSMQFKITYGHKPTESLGLRAENKVTNRELIDNTVFTIPYVGLMKKPWGLSAQLNLGKGQTLRGIGFIGTSENKGVAKRDPFQAASVINYTLDTGAVSVGLMAGALLEKDRILSSESSGAFKAGAKSMTGFGSIQASTKLAQSVTMMASMHHGVTRTDANATKSLFESFSSIHTSSYNLGFLIQPDWTRDDRLITTISQPLRVESGTAEMRIPVGRVPVPGGALITENFKTSLSPSGRQVNLQLGYGFKLWQGDGQFGAIIQRQSGHSRNAKLDYGAGLNLRWIF